MTLNQKPMKPHISAFLTFLFFTVNAVYSQIPYKVVNQSGHTDDVIHCAYSPDGRWLLSIAEDNKLLRWDLHSSRHFAPIEGLSDMPDRIFFLNNEDYIITTKKYTTYKGNVNNPSVIVYEKARFPMAKSELCFGSWEPFVAFRSYKNGDPKLMFYYPNRNQGERFYQCKNAEEVIEGQLESFYFEPEKQILYMGDAKGNVYAMPTATKVVTKLLNVKGESVKYITAGADALVFTVENGELSKRHSLYFCTLDKSELKVSKTKRLSDFMSPIFLTYFRKDKQFYLGNAVIDSFYTAIRHFRNADEYESAKILWRGNRNAPVRVVDINENARQMAVFTFDQKHFVWDLDMNRPIQKLGNTVNAISNFTWDSQTNSMYVYSEKNGRFTSISLETGNSSFVQVPFKPNATNVVLPDGRLLIHNTRGKRLHVFGMDGSKDSIEMPFSEFWNFETSAAHKRVLGYDGKNMLLLNTDDLSVVNRTPAKLGLLTGDFKLTPDEHFFYWKDLNFVDDDTIFLHSTVSGEFAGKYVREKLVDEKYGTVQEFAFVDSGRFVLVNTSVLDTALMYHYSLILVDCKNNGKIKKVYELPSKVEKFVQGRNRNEILIVCQSLLTKAHTYYVLDFKTQKLDSFPLESMMNLGKIQWIDNDRCWVLKDVSDIALFGKNGNLKLVSLSGKNTEYNFSLDEEGFILVSDKGDMICTKGSSNLVSFDIETLAGTRILPGNTLEPYFNKPHSVLKDFGSKDSMKIYAFEKAYEKRMKRIPENAILQGDSLPVASVSLISGSLITDGFEQALTLYFESDYDSIIRLHVEHNGSSKNGLNGVRLEKATKKGSYKFQLKLIPGINRLAFSVEDKKGRRSLIQYIELFLMDDYYFYTPQTYVISIGVSKYKDSAQNLVFASKDSRDIAQWAAKRKNITLDTFINENALWENIVTVKNKLKNIMPEDRVIVSFSGHGLLDKNLDLHLALHETNFQNPAEGGIKLEKLIELLDSTPALHKLLLIDACHSGEIDKDGLVLAEGITIAEQGARGASAKVKVKKQQAVDAFEFMKANFEDAARGNGTIVISAAGGKEYALENETYSNGIFTYVLLQSLNNLEGDANHDGHISIFELKNHVLQKVPEITGGRQKPTMRKEIGDAEWLIY